MKTCTKGTTFTEIKLLSATAAAAAADLFPLASKGKILLFTFFIFLSYCAFSIASCLSAQPPSSSSSWTQTLSQSIAWLPACCTKPPQDQGKKWENAGQKKGENL